MRAAEVTVGLEPYASSDCEALRSELWRELVARYRGADDPGSDAI